MTIPRHKTLQKGMTMKNLKTILLASAFALSATMAFAQGTTSGPTGQSAQPEPNSKSGASSSGTLGANTGPTGAAPQAGVNGNAMVRKDHSQTTGSAVTTGSGMAADQASGKSNGPKSNAAVSPASPNAGEKQEK
jgi:hypothetical protein